MPSSNDAASAAIDLLTTLNAELAGETREEKKVYAMAYSRLVQDKNRNKALDKPVQELLHSTDWLAEMGPVIGYLFDGANFAFGQSA